MKTTLFSLLAPLIAFSLSAQTQPDEAKLLATLQSGAGRFEKSEACRMLARIGTEKSVPVLAALLADAEMSHMARYALETLPHPSVDAALRSALAQTTGLQLVGIIGSIGVRRDAQSVDALAGFLADSNSDIAQAAARALGKIGTDPASKAIEAALEKTVLANRVAFYEGLFLCAEALAAGNRERSMAIYDRLRALPEPHQVRAGGLRGAILARGNAGLELLKQTLTGDDDFLAAAAASTAQELNAPGVAAVLVEALSHHSPDRKTLILRTIGKRRESAALPAVSALALGAPKEVRLAAIQTLSEIGDASSTNLLVGLLRDSDEQVAQLARESLSSLAGPQVDAAVMALFESTEAAQRAAAMELMGRRRMTSAVPALLKASADTDAAVRQSAVKWLGELAGGDQLPALLDLLMRSEGELHAAVEQAVTSICQREADPDQCASRLGALLPQASAERKATLLRILGAVGGTRALEVVRGVVNDTAPETRTAAIRALSTWKDNNAAPDLLAVARGQFSPNDRLLALRSYLALANRPTINPETRFAMATDAAAVVSRPEEKKLLLGILGQMSDPRALDLIARHFEDTGIKEEAATAASSIAELLLGRRGPQTLPASVPTTLENAAKATANDELRQRLTRQANQAKAKVAPGR